MMYFHFNPFTSSPPADNSDDGAGDGADESDESNTSDSDDAPATGRLKHAPILRTYIEKYSVSLILKLISSIPKKKSAFCMKKVIFHE